MMKNTCIVIVDRYRTCGYRLRNRLLACEDEDMRLPHLPARARTPETQTVDAVVLDFGLDEETTAFCAAAKALRVPSFLHALERTGEEEFVGGLCG